MFQAFLIKYGEIGVKGKNRYVFEDALADRIRQVLKDVEGFFRISKEKGRIYVEAEGEFDYEEAVAALQRVFGIVGTVFPCNVLRKRNVRRTEEDVQGTHTPCP